MTRQSWCVAGVVAMVLGFSGAAAAEPPEVRLEGTAARREKLDAIQNKPFDNALWSKLSSWTNGPALSADAIKDKPVMIVSWASWYRSSHKPLKDAQELADKFADKGLVVVGVHDPRGWDLAPQALSELKVHFLMAHDASGDFLKALMEDSHPDFYFIDRAGNLRFADVETSSIAAACEQLVAETPAQAIENAKKAPAPKPAAEADSTQSGPAEADVAFAKPDAAAYAAVKWPAGNSGNISARDFQGKPLPAGLGKEKWLTAKPSTGGRILVIDFWATWCGPCRAAMPHIDDFYKTVKDDVVVMGLSDEPESTVKAFISKNKHSYPQAIDTRGTLNHALGIEGIPHIVVISTDGVVRWQGHPMDEGFQSTVKELIKLDPGVKARRDAEKDAARQ